MEIDVERSTLEPFEREVRSPGAAGRDGGTDVERLHDARGRARKLVEEPALGEERLEKPVASVALQSRGELQALERDPRVEAHVERAVDDAEATLGDHGLDAELVGHRVTDPAERIILHPALPSA